MPTERLYFDDPTLTRFEARVLAVVRHGACPALVLDRTAFYPTGGGQPHDTGRIGDVQVVDVMEDDAGTILHVLAAEPPWAPGAQVLGQVDAARRRDHLQQHSGQHLLSAAFVHAAVANTVSFHLGAHSSTIDLDREPERLGALSSVEDLANRIIAEDRPMGARILDEEEAMRLPLRKELPVRGRVRIVSIDRFDLTPCGGTHARRTAEIGILVLLRAERHRKGTRVEFAAGDRVRSLFRRLHEEGEAIGARLSAQLGERAAALARALDERQEESRRGAELAARAADLEAALLLTGSRPGQAVIVRAYDDRRADDVTALARAVAARGGTVLLGWVEGEAARVVLAGPAERDLAALLRRAGPRFGARGGGSPAFAQAGGIPAARLQEFLEALHADMPVTGS